MVRRFEQARQLLSQARLYVVSADAPPALQAEVLCAAIDGGAGVVQLRHKLVPAAELVAAARRVAAHARAHQAVFLVNDEPGLVEATGADGVHLGQDDGRFRDARRQLPAGALLGRSTHSLGQARFAVAEGADYIGLGPVHATPTKPGRAPVGLAVVTEVGAAIEIPWFAIGGINAGNLAAVTDAGARRVAVVRAVAGAADPGAAAAELLELLRARVPA